MIILNIYDVYINVNLMAENVIRIKIGITINTNVNVKIRKDMHKGLYLES